MKKSLLLCSLFILTLMPQAQASCLDQYIAALIETEDALDKSNYGEKQAAVSVGITSANGALLTSVTGGTGGPTIFTTVSAGALLSVYLGQTVFDATLSDDQEKLASDRRKLETAIGVIKESVIYNGPFLMEAVTQIWRTVSRDVSLQDVAEAVEKLNNDNRFCENGEITTPAGLLALVIEEISLK